MRILSFLFLVFFLSAFGANDVEEGLVQLAGGKDAQAYKTFSKVFETSGDPKALFYMGYLNMNLLNNYPLGLSQVRQAANMGYPEALTQIGFLYFKAGRYRGALGWLQRAAKLKHPKAMYMIGYMYEHGLGVTQDSVMARRWYSKAGSAPERS